MKMCDYSFAGYIDLESGDYPVMPDGLCRIPFVEYLRDRGRTGPKGVSCETIFGHALPYVPDGHYVIITRPRRVMLVRNGGTVTPLWNTRATGDGTFISARYDFEHGAGGPVRLIVGSTDHGLSIREAEDLRDDLDGAIFMAKALESKDTGFCPSTDTRYDLSTDGIQNQH